MGARDRRQVQELVFHYFRLNKALVDFDIETAILLAHIYCSKSVDDFSRHWIDQKNIVSHHNDNISSGCLIKTNDTSFLLSLLYRQFPASDHISQEIITDRFLLSHLQPPCIWIRTKRSMTEKVIEELRAKNIKHILSELSPQAIGFIQPVDFSKLDSFRKGWFEIQDISSQLTAQLFQAKPGEHWWDSCAASGGKSLLLKDLQPDIYLLASDKRSSILTNLHLRFRRAGIDQFDVKTIDLEQENPSITTLFDGIIADVPCSGSGTWARTPERMTYFQEEDIEYYAHKQKNILKRLIPQLKPKGKLIYITCSVYASENEQIIDWLLQRYPVKTEAIVYFKGYDYGADTLFAARLRKLS